MKAYTVLIKKIQRIEVTVEAKSKLDAIKFAEDPNNANWYAWDEVEIAEYVNEGIVENN